ncbi:MAG: alpha/beta fold hydrolase, partial [Acidobacteria bacterium]|nr:alpha/beta fold hydrolase [Acidobacteriota bacterium]
MATDNAPAGWLTDFAHDGKGKNAKIGIVLVHGFTGSPASMRPWAQYLQDLGFTVRVPRIPGHGTKWQDLNHVKWHEWPDRVQNDIDDLHKICEKIFVFGLSMGGGNTLYVAAKNPEKITGIVLVNPMIHIPGVKIKFGRLLAKLKAGMPSVGDDIK